jgi:hypothetical protein
MQASLSHTQALSLMSAAASGEEATVRALLQDERLATNCRDTNGWTPLMRAAHGGHRNIVNMLLTAPTPAQARLQNKYGKTALHYACGNGHAVIAQVLLLYGADARQRDAASRTAVDEASESGFDDLVDELLAKLPGAMLPRKPGAPLVIKVDSSGGLVLVWEPAPSAGGVGTGVTAYRVQVALAAPPNGARRWQTVVSDAVGTTYTLRGLTPHAAVVARVSANNAYGWGEPSEPSEPIAVMTAGSSVAAVGSDGGSAHGGAGIMFWGPATSPSPGGKGDGESGSRSASVGRARGIGGGGGGGGATSPTTRRGWPDAFPVTRGSAADTDEEADAQGRHGGGHRLGGGEPWGTHSAGLAATLPPRPARARRRSGGGDDSKSVKSADGGASGHWELASPPRTGLRAVHSTSNLPRPGGKAAASCGVDAGHGDECHGDGGSDGGPAPGSALDHMSNGELHEVLTTLRTDLREERQRRGFLEGELLRYTASGGALADMSVDELAALEGALEDSVKAVRQAKERRMKEALAKGGDSDALSRTLCSVCLTRPKNMLFLPCKHLCACSTCAERIMRPPAGSSGDGGGGKGGAPVRPLCPICRTAVEQVLDVYA